ncbi:MAG: DUF2007 domain-containing protein [Candidatus Omnitrophota bacterium]|nr:DUF2007 domain-containing protein [Candidatus Omnitrophota bacterium]
MRKRKLVSLYTFNNIIEGERLRNLLEEEKIQVMIRSLEDSAYDGIFRLQVGAGKIMIFEEDVERGREIIKEFSKNSGEA